MKKFLAMLIALVLSSSLAGCGGEYSTVLDTPAEQEEKEVPRLTFIADFYSNDGSPWLSVEGTTFSISPNKVKEYSYDTDGSWIAVWTMSSVMSVEIDGNFIESCGSTIIFADSSLEKYEIDLPAEVTVSEGGNSSITVPGNYRLSDYWTVQHWWYDRQTDGNQNGRKIIVVQSQTGEPICMYMGDNVTWEVAKNLPKTTLIYIDGKALYIHRSNFAIIDTSVFGG